MARPEPVPGHGLKASGPELLRNAWCFAARRLGVVPPLPPGVEVAGYDTLQYCLRQLKWLTDNSRKAQFNLIDTGQSEAPYALNRAV